MDRAPYLEKLHERNTILIADNWKTNKFLDKAPHDGGTYLGSGYYKFGVKVSILYLIGIIGTYKLKSVYHGRRMALFQCIPRSAVTEEDNLDLLQAELCGLTVASIYMDQMKELAKSKAIQLPGK